MITAGKNPNRRFEGMNEEPKTKVRYSHGTNASMSKKSKKSIHRFMRPASHLRATQNFQPHTLVVRVSHST